MIHLNTSTVLSGTRLLYDGWNVMAELSGASGTTTVWTCLWGTDLSGASQQAAGGVGGLLNDETGHLYYGHRYDTAELGRWLSRDPIEELGEGPGQSSQRGAIYATAIFHQDTPGKGSVLNTSTARRTQPFVAKTFPCSFKVNWAACKKLIVLTHDVVITFPDPKGGPITERGVTAKMTDASILPIK